MAKLFKKMWLQFLIFYVKCIPNKIEFPYPLSFKVFSNIFPVVVDFLNESEVWFDNFCDRTEIYFFLLDILPKSNVAVQYISETGLNLIEFLLSEHQILKIKTAIVQLPINGLILLFHYPPYPGQSEFIKWG